MLEKTTPCWFQRRKLGTCLPESGWRPGEFYQFAQDHLEYDSGPGPIPVAIVKDLETCGIVLVYPELLTFATKPPGERDQVQM